MNIVIVLAIVGFLILLIIGCAKLMRWLDRIEFEPPEWMKGDKNG